MNRLAMVIVAALVLMPVHAANSQTLDARRTGMGSVSLASGGPSSQTSNVAYRAVPALPHRSAGFSLPIGLIATLSNLPTFDPDDPEFNVYEIANLAYNMPWNLQLTSPTVPSNDIVVSVGRNSLAVELGEVGDIFPEDGSTFGTVSRLPTLGFGVSSFFVGASGLVDFENTLSLSPQLHAALANGDAFEPNTEYTLYDDARGQAALMFETGWAGALSQSALPDAQGDGFYAGARIKLLRGMAYADADNDISFATSDTLFSAAPIDFNYQGLIHDAGPDGGGWGTGIDLGAVWVKNGFELGVGVNDIGTKLDWTTRERVALRTGIDNEYEFITIGEDVEVTSKVPVTTTFNVARHFGATLVAADFVRRANQSAFHLGLERWFGMFALRSGIHTGEQQLQYAGGAGVRLGRVGFDLGVATHNRNLTRERTVELAAGLSFYQ